MKCFFKGDKNVGFDIRPAFGGCFASAESAERRTSTTAAEKCFEEIAEASAAEFEFNAAVATRLIKSAAGLTAPLRRRLKSTGLVPIRAELIVFLTLLRIAQDFVSLIDLLKFFFGGLFVFRDVGMIFARQFPERAF